MGLLSFMAKKPGDRNRSTALKSQAYSSTTAGAVPIRGTYPVAGNGPSAFETIAKSHPRLGRTQALKDKASVGGSVSGSFNGSVGGSVSPALAPSVSSHSRDSPLDRPRTAPNGSSGTPAKVWATATTTFTTTTTTILANSGRGAKSSFRRPPPVSLRPPQLVLVTSNISSTVSAAQESPISKARSNSIRSEAGRPGHKDILDAQSELKPADFRARIKATGARDYGEDVADRNIGENGRDVASSPVKAVYAEASAWHPPHPPFSAAFDISRPYHNSDPFLRPGSKQASGGVTEGTKILHTASPPRPVRRQSLNTYLPTGLTLGASGLHKFSQSCAAPTDIQPVAAPSGPDDVSSWDASQGMGIGSAIGGFEPGFTSGLPGIAFRTSSPWTGRASDCPKAAAAKKGRPGTSAGVININTGTCNLNFDAPPPGRHSLSDRSFPLRPSAHSQRGSATDFSSRASSPSKAQRQIPPALESPISSIIASFEKSVATDRTPSACSREKPRQPPIEGHPVHIEPDAVFPSVNSGWRIGRLGEVDVDDSSDLDYAPSPCISRYAKETTFDGRHSPGAGLRPGHGESDSVAVGVRRRWSLASDSPLASDNSNCWSSSTSRFRPQSRQTADTSVDSPYLVPPSLKTASSYGSLTSQGSNGAAVYQRKLNQFNIDDHVSTDEDSVYATRRPSPGKGEEDLLFPQDGFGMDGCSLPGLATLSFAYHPQPSYSPQRRISPGSTGSVAFSNFSGDGAPPSAADGDAVAAEDSDLESWHDALTDQEHASGRAPRLALSPSPSLSVRRGGQDDGVAAHDPKRPSALGTLYGHAYFGLGCVDGIVRQPGREPGRARMSQREEAFVIRARKEAKARRRAAERGEASAARRRSMMKVDSGSSK